MSFYTDFIQVPSQGPAGLKGERGDPGPTNTNVGAPGSPGSVGLNGLRGLPGVSGGEIYTGPAMPPFGNFVPWAPTLKHITATEFGFAGDYHGFWNFYGGESANVFSGSTSGVVSNNSGPPSFFSLDDTIFPATPWIENTGYAYGGEPAGFYEDFWIFVKKVSGEDHVWSGIGGAGTPFFTLGTWVQLNGTYLGWERYLFKFTITRSGTNTGTSEGELDFWVVQSGAEPTGDPSIGGESPSATFLGRVKSTVIVP